MILLISVFLNFYSLYEIANHTLFFFQRGEALKMYTRGSELTKTTSRQPEMQLMENFITR